MVKKIVAYKPKDEADYLSFFSELINKGFISFLTGGYREGTYLASEVGTKLFTDGHLSGNVPTVFVSTIEEYITESKRAIS